MNENKTYIYYKDGMGYSKLPVSFNNFPDGDTHCLVENIERVSGKKILIFHALYPNQNERLIRLVLLLDVLSKHPDIAVSIFVPYLPYARQDKKHQTGEAVASTTICKLLARFGCDKLYTVDCHFMKGAPQTVVGGLTIINLLVTDDLLSACRVKIGEGPYHVISPDEGSNYLVNQRQGQSMVKHRAIEHSNQHGYIYREITSLESSHLGLSYDTVIIIDDMISTGSTMLKAIENLRQCGIKKIYVVTTHPLFLNGSYEKIVGTVEACVYSDTIAQPGSLSIIEPLLQDKVLPALLA